MQIQEHYINDEYLEDGQNKRITCPSCNHLRKKKHEKTLSLTRKGDKIVYQCWHCQLSGAVNMNKQPNKSTSKKTTPIAVLQQPEVKNTGVGGGEIKQTQKKFLESRGISEDTAKKYGVLWEDRGFNGVGTKEAIGFPYYVNDKLQAVKWRSIDGKSFTQDGASRSLFGLDKLNINDLIVICEGELDALALYEAGIDCAVSVPNGAVMKVSNNKISPEEDKKFSYIWEAAEELDKIKKIVLCCDNDESGKALTEELARRIGKNKVWLAQIPQEYKDANECLLKAGEKLVQKAVHDAKPYPLSSLYPSSHYENSVVDLYDKGFMTGVSTGFDNVDELFRIAGGQLSIITGIPSSGKSEFIDMMMMNLARNEDWKFAICSFENPPDLHIAKLVEKYVGKSFFSGSTQRMTEDERDNALRFVEEHFLFIDYTGGESPTIDSIIEKGIGAVRQMGCRGIVIDPYNYIDMDRSFSETDSISRMLTKISQFAKAHDVHVFFVSHPMKLYPDSKGNIPIPTGYNISGSASWFSKADVGITVHREETNMVAINCWKCRFKWIGKQGQTMLSYDVPTGVYSDIEAIDFEDRYDFEF
jgi:twinkle protein